MCGIPTFAFFIQYCYFWYVHGISCCVIFCYVIWCIHKSHLGVFASVTSIAAVCILVYVFFGTCVEVSVCILRKSRERKIGKEKGERQGGRERERERREEFLGRRLYMSSVLLIIAKLLSKVIAPVTLPLAPLPCQCFF